ncbi:hypothetical protein [Desulfatibacillum aliphaticivorans]|nr:hypothetical protein [Desulfatibacillum aliphaticivorans]
MISGYLFEGKSLVSVCEYLNNFQNDKGLRDLRNMMYGDEPVSLYEFNRRVLQVTPDQISFFDSMDEIRREFLQLMLKPSRAGERQCTAFTENLNIIQSGFPTPNPPDIGAAFGPVRCLVFGNNDKSYEISFIGLDQEAIDCILTSFEILERPLVSEDAGP